MTSQRVERTWIRTGGYGRFRGEWVNDIIPGTVVRIKRDSKRVKERLRVTISLLTGSIRKKNRSVSEKQKNEILNGWTNLSILAGDIMNPGEMGKRGNCLLTSQSE